MAKFAGRRLLGRFLAASRMRVICFKNDDENCPVCQNTGPFSPKLGKIAPNLG